MFDCCDNGYAMTTTDTDDQLDLDEPADALNVLLCLLHTPPSAPESIQEAPKKQTSEKRFSTTLQPLRYEPGSVIPFPLLPRMLQLADKYALSANISRSLMAHLAAHASAYPLEVYGFAVERGSHSLATEASKYLLHPPLSEYAPKALKVIPTPEAWHKLVLLHDVRIRGLREILVGEEIFPHGYGACSSHKDKTMALWAARKMDIILRIEAGLCSPLSTFA